MSSLTLGIVGQGAMGSLIAKSCQQHHIPYLIATRNPKTALPVTVHDLTATTLNGPLLGLNALQRAHVLVLPVKAYQLQQALIDIEPSIQPQQVVVLLHNGMGGIELAKAAYPNNPIIAGTSSYGALKHSPCKVQQTGQGESHFGWVSSNIPKNKNLIEQTLSQLFPPCTWHRDIQLALWHKLAINCVINPLTAIDNVQNGALTHSQYAEKINALCHEITAVMNKLGYVTTTAELQQRVLQVAKHTAQNYSSMHQDVANRRPTEIEFITGYVVARATELALEVPHNKQLLHGIRALSVSQR